MPIHDPLPERFGRSSAAETGDAPATPAPAAPGGKQMSAAMLREWVRAAQPGARAIYAVGHFVDQFAARDVAELARRLGPNGSGHIRLHLKRNAKGSIDYLAYRTARPVPKGMAL